MSDGDAPPEIASVVLAAGSGTRLRPLTLARPKALCPVGTTALVDLAIDRATAVSSDVAVNIHAGRAQMLAHLDERRDGQPLVHVSDESGRALGTAGALGLLRSWIAGRATLVLNADAWCQPDLAAFVGGWDGERVRLLVVDEDVFHPRSRVAAALMPWTQTARFEAEPSGLYEVSWRAEHEADRLDVTTYRGGFVDCGTPHDYLRANLLAAAQGSERSIVSPTAMISGSVEQSVVGAGATVAGRIERTVVWDHASVAEGEHLVDAVRYDDGRTVLLR